MKRFNLCRWFLVVSTAGLAACGSVSNNKQPDAGEGSGDDAGIDGAGSDADPGCTAGAALSCSSNTLTKCKSDGSGEETVTCSLGCHATEVRCNNVDPSNGLAAALDQAAAQPALDLGSTATINGDSGEVKVDGTVVTVVSSVTGSSPPVRVYSVGSLTAADVTVTGTYAVAIVSHGDIVISGHLSTSATQDTSGPGALNDVACVGKDTVTGANGTISGSGGGGFGTAGGKGGNANNTQANVTATGGNGGAAVGTVSLTPLRGGCDSGIYSGSVRGHGGGAVQLVSGTKIRVEGIISANGSSWAGGGSGGGILLEAPAVDVSGKVVANGGGGAGGGFAPNVGENGRLDAQPAAGGPPVDVTNGGAGGSGAAGVNGANNGANKQVAGIALAGHGGGGAGRIRVNTAPAGFAKTGVVSPNPSTGNVAVR